MDIFLGGNVTAPEFLIMGSIFDDAVLVHNHLLLCVMYCWPLKFQLHPTL